MIVCDLSKATIEWKNVATVWQEIRRVYEKTKLDFVYAYGGADRLVRINAMYERTIETRCKIVPVTHAEHSALSIWTTQPNWLVITTLYFPYVGYDDLTICAMTSDERNNDSFGNRLPICTDES